MCPSAYRGGGRTTESSGDAGAARRAGSAQRGAKAPQSPHGLQVHLAVTTLSTHNHRTCYAVIKCSKSIDLTNKHV